MFLLDTRALLWLVAGSEDLSQVARKKIQKNADKLFVSSITAFEVALKHKRKKLKLPLSPDEWFKEAISFHGIREVGITSEISIRAAFLPDHHNDPFDRLIIATALENQLSILTSDEIFSKYKEVNVVW